MKQLTFRLIVITFLACVGIILLGITAADTLPSSWVITYATLEDSGYWALRRVAVERALEMGFMPSDLFQNLPAISSDDRYAAWWTNDIMRIYDSHTEQTHTFEGAYSAVWSQAASQTRLAFIQEGALYTLDLAPDGTPGTPLLLMDESYEVLAASWSPDGSRLAVLTFPPNTGRYSLYLCDLNGETPRRLLVSTSRIYPPGWSSDGTELVYDLQGNLTRLLYRLNVDNPIPEEIHIDNNWATYPVWSPQTIYGDRIAFLSDMTGFISLYSLKLNDPAAQPQLLSLLMPDVSYVWSPEGSRIAFINASDNDLYWTYVADFVTISPFPSFRLTDNEDYNVILK